MCETRPLMTGVCMYSPATGGSMQAGSVLIVFFIHQTIPCRENSVHMHMLSQELTRKTDVEFHVLACMYMQSKCCHFFKEKS